MKKVILLLAMLPMFITAQSRYGIAIGGSYGLSPSGSIGFTSQNIASSIGFNADFKGSTNYDWNKVKQPYYEMGKINYSALLGLNFNIKRFIISVNGGASFLEIPKFKPNWTGQTGPREIKGCYEGLIGYNVIDKEKYVINIRAGYNNNYGGLLNIGFLF